MSRPRTTTGPGRPGTVLPWTGGRAGAGAGPGVAPEVADGLLGLGVVAAQLLPMVLGVDPGPATVKTHVGRVLTKLGLRDRVEAVIWACEAGLVQPGR
jgi:hypothetical protein